MSKTEPLSKHRDELNDVKTGSYGLIWDEFGENLISCPSGIRCLDGMTSVLALMWNSGTSRLDAKEKVQVVKAIKDESTNANHWGGTIRSSIEDYESNWSKGIVLFSLIKRSTAQAGGIYE